MEGERVIKNGVPYNEMLDRERIVENREGIVVLENMLDGARGTIESCLNAQREAEERGWVTKIVGEEQAGIYSYQEPMVKLMTAFKGIIREMAANHRFHEMIFPRHYRANALAAFGWIDHERLNKELMRTTHLIPSEGRSNYELLSDPVQCLGFYETLRVIQAKHGRSLPHHLFENGTMRVYEDQGGWTLRNELHSRLKGGFATAFEFSGAEIVWAGTEDATYETRWEMVDAVLHVLSGLELPYRVITGGSCSRDRKSPELVGKKMELYKIPTLDIELFIPYLAAVDRDPWIEVGGGDVAGTRLTRNFELRMEGGEELHSGCQGIGWQRLCYGFLSQKGFEKERWPAMVQERLGYSSQ